MNYLFTGKSGVFETVIAALVFMNKENDIEKYLAKTKVFGNIEQDDKREPIFIREDNKGNKVYTLGTTNYNLIHDICTELSRVAGQKKINLVVVTVKIRGESLTYYLSRLASIPLIGSWFNFLAKRWVMYRKDKIIEECKRMYHQKKDLTPELMAAKPIK